MALRPVGDRPALERAWLDLQVRSDHSFFQSWGWIGLWLDMLPATVGCVVMEARRDGRVVGLGLLADRTVRRRGFVRSRVLSLHETGDQRIDPLCIEHNGFLVDRDDAPAVLAALLGTCAGRLADGEWDEVRLPGVPPSHEPPTLPDGVGLLAWKREVSYVVDLAAIRRAGGGFLAAARKNLRRNIRRALEVYRPAGRPTFELAGSAGEALAQLDRLAVLHERRWQAKGEPGAFASPYFRRFHERLIATRFDAGEIQMAIAAFGGQPVGYLYNFVYGGRVYTYQAGFDYDTGAAGGDGPARPAPGVVSDYLAIEHNLAAGAGAYDFLHGDTEHKRSFSTGMEPRLWLVLQRDRLAFRIENGLRRAKRRLQPSR